VAFAADQSPTAGIVHATLGSGAAAEGLDLFGSQFRVNDIHCTDPEGAEAVSPGWLARTTCAV